MNRKNEYIEKLRNILDKNKDKRVCVVGTSCTGKTTYLNETNNGLDMDKIIFPLLSEKEKEYVCQTPWTEEIGQEMDRLVREKIKIQPGKPVFGTVIIDCDLIIYLKISDELLRKRTESRKVNFDDAKNMQKGIEEDLSQTKIPIITVEVKEREIEMER